MNLSLVSLYFSWRMFSQFEMRSVKCKGNEEGMPNIEALDK
jgi:hypothetical protein